MPRQLITANFKKPLCAEIGPELFFSEKGSSRNTQAARLICQRCPEIEPCRAFVLEHTEIKHGVWAGMNMKEICRLRAAINRERRNAQQAA